MYTHKSNEGNLDIYREGTHVATYDPVEEEVTYTAEENKRFKMPITKYLNGLDEEAPEENVPDVILKEDPPKPPSEVTNVAPIKEMHVTDEIKHEIEEHFVETPEETTVLSVGETTVLSAEDKVLKRENERLQLENVRLKDEVQKLRGDQVKSVQRVADRYSDEFDDSEGKHLMGPHGDLTPEYVEWARENMPEEIFDKRYLGRL